MSYTPTAQDIRNVAAWKTLIGNTILEGPVPPAPAVLPGSEPPAVLAPPPAGVVQLDLPPDCPWALAHPGWLYSLWELNLPTNDKATAWFVEANTEHANGLELFMGQWFCGPCYVATDAHTLDRSQPYPNTYALASRVTKASAEAYFAAWVPVAPQPFPHP